MGWDQMSSMAKLDGTKSPVLQKWHGINSPWDQLFGPLISFIESYIWKSNLTCQNLQKPKTLVLGMQESLVVLCKDCSNYSPRIKKAPPEGSSGSYARPFLFIISS